jgi:hypothetical protein
MLGPGRALFWVELKCDTSTISKRTNCELSTKADDSCFPLHCEYLLPQELALLQCVFQSCCVM